MHIPVYIIKVDIREARCMRIISKLLPASKKKLVVSGIGVLALVLFTGFILVEATKAEVDITENGEKQTVKTQASTVEELLDQVGITVGEHDALSHSVDIAITDGMKIDYKTAKQIVVSIDGKEQEYYTTFDTIGEFLSDEDLTLSDRDDVSHEGKEPIEDGLHITIDKAYAVAIDDGGKKKKVWTTGSTIEELLKKNHIKVNNLDKVKPAIDKKAKKDTDITIVRVEKEIEEVEEKVDFEIETEEDDSLAKGEEKVVSEGQEGTIVKKYEVVFENDKEVNRELVSEDVQEKGEKRIIAMGTKELEEAEEPAELEETEQNLVTLVDSKPKSKKRSEPKPESKANDDEGNLSNDRQRGKELSMTATAYSASCNGCSGVTATGINLNNNPDMKVVAVDPGVIPLGSKVWVEGYGEAIAGDTGGAINGNRIDLHVPSKGEANAFGNQDVKVKVIN